MKRVLFTHSYFLRFDPKQWKQQQPYPPLATLYAAAALRKEGYDVELFDTMFARSPEELAAKMESWHPDVVVIYDDGFNFLTKMCLTNMREAAFKMCALARERGCPVVVCSSDATDHFEKYLDHGADYIITGEGEITLAMLMQHLAAGKDDAETIEGLVFRRNGSILKNRKRDVLRDLDALAMPAWDLVDISEYKRRWIKSSGYFSLNISTTRGCPFHCNWCAKPIYGNRYHAHSPARVVQELKLLTRQLGARHIWVTDDIFGLKPGWVGEFADLVKAENLDFRFKIQSRVDLLLQENAVAALARAGCETVWVGAESGSQKILDAMEKGTRVEQIAEATRQLKKHGIKPAFFLQFGYPGETREDIDATLEMVAELMPDDIGVSVSYPLPGTKFYERVADQLREGGQANWKDSDELAVLFQSTFQAPFYKELQRYLHKRFRLKQGLDAWKRFTQAPAQIRAADLKRMAAISYHLPGLFLHGRRMKTLEKQDLQVQKCLLMEPFDNAAASYDQSFTFSETGRRQREVIRKYLETDPFLRSPKIILEVNCGTGEDALWLAARGHSVIATDSSEAMLAEARKKEREKMATPPQFLRLDMKEEEWHWPDATFDMLFSNFAGLNCFSPVELQRILLNMNRLLKPGGRLVMVLFGKYCLSETFYFLLRGKPGTAIRRWSGKPSVVNVEGSDVPVYYHAPDEMTSMLPGFRLRKKFAVGLFLPPSYLDASFKKHRNLAGLSEALENRMGKLGLLSGCGDHILLDFEKR